MKRRVLHWLTHPRRFDWLGLVVIFWFLQFVGWTIMIVVVQVRPKPFTSSLLYTIQISHWALVESAFTSLMAAWALLQSKHNARKLAEMQADVTEVQERQ